MPCLHHLLHHLVHHLIVATVCVSKDVFFTLLSRDSIWNAEVWQFLGASNQIIF